MSDTPESSSKGNSHSGGSSGGGSFDPSSMFLSSLYGLNAFGSGGTSSGNGPHPLASALAGLSAASSSSPASSTTDTLGVAASQAASLGINGAWYAMAQQLAAQDYMARLSAANPTYAAALAAVQRSSPLSNSSAAAAALRLPSDTELIKQKSPRGRKKTIGLDPGGAAAVSAAAANMFLNNLSALNNAAAAASSSSTPVTNTRGGPSLPSGLTIERKKVVQRGKGGSCSSSLAGGGGSAPPIVDRVEITKVPISNGGSKSQDDAPLNLSLKTSAPPSNKIPTDYYASQALSGAFLAEQIRQSQLAAALESRLESSSSHLQAPLASPSVANLQNIQAALLMNKLKASNSSQGKSSRSSSKGKKTTAGSSGLTVASLLSKHRNGGAKGGHTSSTISQEEVDRAEKSVSSNPELTIEPIFKSSDKRRKDSSPWRRGGDTEEAGKGSSSLSGEDSVLIISKENPSPEEEGKLKIKNVGDSPEIRNLSDQEDEEGGYEEEESEEEFENGNVIEAEAQQRFKGLLPDTLRLPLARGWKREALVREYSKSGFRGDIFYYAPCGKKFKQYSEILRYLEKRGIKDLQREHFSFSTKVLVGEFLKPTGQAENGEEKYLRLNEKEMLEDLEAVRKENGWGNVGTSKSGKRSSSTPKGTSNGKEDKQQQILLETLQQNQKESSDALMHRDAMKLLKEAERVKELKKAQEEAASRLQRSALEANIKIQEREMKRQQTILLKEQERERRRQHMIFIKLLEGKRRSDERERRREDLRLEKEKDRERRIEQRRLEYEIITELKKPCEDMSLIQDAKPIPKFERIKGMALSGEAFANALMIHEFVHNFGDTLGFDVDALPSLSSLQSAMLNDPDYEEELLSVVIHLVVCAIEDPGIPTPNKHLTLMGQNLRQADITNTNISEILKIYLFARGQAEVKACHGFIPPPEFFHLNSNGPVHHLSHYHYYKDRKLREEGPNLEEYTSLLHDTKPFKMSEWVKDKPFLCLNPLEKSEILAYLCNELLGNKAVMAQVDNNLDNILAAKKRRWATENKLKKLRMLQQRKFKPQPYSPLPANANQSSNEATPGGGVSTPPNSEPPGNSELDAGSDKEEDDNTSLASVKSENKDSSSNPGPASSPPPPPPVFMPNKRKGRPPGSKKRKWSSGKAQVQTKKRKSKDPVAPDDGGGDPSPKEGEPPESQDKVMAVASDDDDEEDELDDDIGEDEEKMSQEELQKKVDKTLKLLNKRRDELIQSNNRFRASDLGQDRFRRRYWHLAFVDGIFVEGMESSEPWKLETDGMPTEEKRLKLEANQSKSDALSSSDEEEDDDEEGLEETNVVKKEENDDEEREEDSKALVEKKEVKEEGPKEELVKLEDNDDRSMLKITPNGDKLNLFNHSAQYNMSLSPVILNGSVTITPKQQTGDSTGLICSSTSSGISKDSPWFSILPMGNPMSENPSIPITCEDKTQSYLFHHNNHYLSPTPHIEMLENKLASIRKSDEEKERIPIPKEFTRGWWRITSSELLRNVEYSLHPRGCREHGLLGNLKKCVEALVHHHYDGSKNPATIGDDIEFELSEALKAQVTLDEYEAPLADEPGKWSEEVALRVEKYILEQVEALEDKVAAASMQVPGWKLPNREDIEDRQFRPSCLPPGKEDSCPLPDAISEAKERLLDLEQNIERRYLKAPLGFGNNEPTLQTITSVRTTMNSSKTPLDESPTEMQNGKTTNNNNHVQGNAEDEENGIDESGDEQSHSKKESEEVLPRGLQTWREGVQRAKNAAQLAMGFYVLETSIAWHKSIMKAFCQLCHSGDNEDSLLLCDGCDKGYHMYCFKPSLSNVPEGDWYCFECINKATGIKHCLVCGKQEGRNLIHCSQCPRAYHTDCLSPALSKSPRGKWQCPACQARAPSSSRKKSSKKAKFTVDSSPAITDNEDSKDVSDTRNHSSPAQTPLDVSSSAAGPSEESRSEDSSSSSKPTPAKKKKISKIDRDLTACSTLLSELENSEEAWPFLYPVNTKQFPTYRKVIKNPMDIATIKRRLESGVYKLREDFCSDVRQIFANCEIFNEDDSPVGKAGHAMRTFFEARWAELTSI